jgi:UDP-perosamine 4-acetyltransferase
VVLDCLLVTGRIVAGIIDAALPRGTLVHGIAVRGGDEQLAQLEPRTSAVCIGVGVMPGTTRRAEIFADCCRRGLQLVSVIHPSAVLSPRLELGEGVQVLAGALVQTGTRLGDNVIVNTAASVDHDCALGRGVMIGPGAVLCGEVTIGADAYIGAGAVILPGVQIGADAIIGAGSVVIRDVASGVKVAGNPARTLGLPGDSHA